MHMIDVMKKLQEIAEAGYDNEDIQRGIDAAGKHAVTEAAKPDFLDLDGDGDKEEPMKKAAKDAEEIDESSEEWNSDEVIRALNSSGEEMALDDPELGEFLDMIADRVNQSHPTSVSYSDLMNILNEPWSRGPKFGHLQNMAKEELDFALKAAGILESIDGYSKMMKNKEEVAEDMAWLRKAAGIGSGAKSNHGIYEGEEGYQITPRSLVAREMRKLQDIAKD